MINDKAVPHLFCSYFYQYWVLYAFPRELHDNFIPGMQAIVSSGQIIQIDTLGTELSQV